MSATKFRPLTHNRCSVCEEIVGKYENEDWPDIFLEHYQKNHPDIIMLFLHYALVKGD